MKLNKMINQIGKKKIDESDIKDIKKLQELVDQHLLIADGIRMILRNFLNSKMSKYGLDGNKQWNFDIEGGVINEVKRTLQQVPPMPQQAPPTPPKEATK